MTVRSYWGRLRARLRADVPFHLFVTLYGCAALALALHLGRPEKMLALKYAQRFAPLILSLLALYVAWQAIVSLKARSPLRQLKSRLAKALTPELVSRFLLFANVAIFYGIFTSFKRMLADLRAFSFDMQLAQLDYVLHGSDPWLLLPASDLVTRTIQFFYLQGWLICLVLFSFYMIVFQPRVLMHRFLVTFYLIWILLGNVLAGIFMSAGPVYFKAVTSRERFEPLYDRLEPTFGMMSSSVTIQDRLWEDYMLDLGLLGSGISAFPSLHIAMATLWAVTAWSISKALFVASLVVLVLVQFGSVYLGWHYAVDGYFFLRCGYRFMVAGKVCS